MIKIMKQFLDIIRDFKQDILITYPEYEGRLCKEMQELDEEKLKAYCTEVYPEYFFDILYKKNDLFKKPVYFLPEINFKHLWEQEISDTTRDAIWNYLQLILFNVIEDVEHMKSFGDTAKLFEAIDTDEFKDKLDECLKNMNTIFNKTDASGNPIPNPDQETNVPEAEEIHDHINTMLDGKLGRLAKEIAEETAEDLKIENTDDIFKQLFSNPDKLMNLVKHVGGKLDSKMKSGDLNEDELMSEAKDLMSKMKDNPILGNIFNTLGKNQNQFQQKMRQSEMRDKMRQKMKEKKEGKDKEKISAGIWEQGGDNLDKKLKEANEKAERIMQEILAEENTRPIISKKKKTWKKKEINI